MTIEEYLAELRRHLKVGPLAKRRILREVETHLREAAEREGDEWAAVAAFGSAEATAARFARRRLPRALAAASAFDAGVVVAAFAVSGTSPTASPDFAGAILARAYCGGINAPPVCLRLARKQIARRQAWIRTWAAHR